MCTDQVCKTVRDGTVNVDVMKFKVLPLTPDNECVIISKIFLSHIHMFDELENKCICDSSLQGNCGFDLQLILVQVNHLITQSDD